jgi:hypothetical protein
MQNCLLAQAVTLVKTNIKHSIFAPQKKRFRTLKRHKKSHHLLPIFRLIQAPRLRQINPENVFLPVSWSFWCNYCDHPRPDKSRSNSANCGGRLPDPGLWNNARMYWFPGEHLLGQWTLHYSPEVCLRPCLEGQGPGGNLRDASLH